MTKCVETENLDTENRSSKDAQKMKFSNFDKVSWEFKKCVFCYTNRRAKTHKHAGANQTNGPNIDVDKNPLVAKKIDDANQKMDWEKKDAFSIKVFGRLLRYP